MIVELFKTYPQHKHLADRTTITDVDPTVHFGQGYQDLGFRVPSIDNARHYLGWEPKVDLRTALKRTLDYHLGHPEDVLEEISEEVD